MPKARKVATVLLLAGASLTFAACSTTDESASPATTTMATEERPSAALATFAQLTFQGDAG